MVNRFYLILVSLNEICLLTLQRIIQLFFHQNMAIKHRKCMKKRAAVYS